MVSVVLVKWSAPDVGIPEGTFVLLEVLVTCHAAFGLRQHYATIIDEAVEDREAGGVLFVRSGVEGSVEGAAFEDNEFGFGFCVHDSGFWF
jgi:hypothetical protein